MPKATTDKQVIKSLGGPAIVAGLLGNPYSEKAVEKWMSEKRGIPWKVRSKVARLAASKRVKIPSDFADERRVA